MIPYHFTILRYLHSYSAGELINVGLVMWSPTARRFLFFVNHKYGRLSAVFSQFDGAGYRAMVKRLSDHLRRIQGEANARQTDLFRRAETPSLQDIMPRLLLEDSSCFQWSSIMAGITEDLGARFRELVEEMVTYHTTHTPRARWDENRIWDTVEAALEARKLGGIINPIVLGTERYSYEFRTGWKNGVMQVLEPISFDYREPGPILEKATSWIGRLKTLSKGPAFKMTAIIIGPESSDLSQYYENAVEILSEAPQIRRLAQLPQASRIRQLGQLSNIDEVLQDIEKDLAH